ncbi:MAG: nucleotide-binding protein [Clostridium sp.]
MKIFIGSSTESKDAIYDITEIIRGGMPQHECVPWFDDEVFKASEYTLDSLIRCSKEVDCAIFIFNADDKVKNSKGEFLKTRDNVLIEYGLFVSALGRKNVVILHKDKTDMPSDLSGITYIAMDIKMHLKLQEWLKDSSSNIDKHISSCSDNDEIAVDINKSNKIKVLKSDSDGYYSAIVKEIRSLSKNGRYFTAYKLDGLIINYKNKRINIVDGESQWLLYDNKRFQKLSEKDQVKFRVDDIDNLRSYRGGEKTRNIFVGEVVRINNNQY